MAPPCGWAVLVLSACAVRCSLAETTAAPEVPSELDADSQQHVMILKRINRVNDDGSYTYGYEAADGSFKIETRDVAGNVKGVFGYLDETGKIKRVSYSTKNGTEYQSGLLFSPKSEMSTTASASLTNQQILRPQVNQVASASTTTESFSVRRPVFRPFNPRSTTESTTTSTSKNTDQAIRKVYPVYNPYQLMSSRNKSFDGQSNAKGLHNRTILKKEQTNPIVTAESPSHTITTKRPVHAVYGQYIRQPLTQLHRMQNHSLVSDSGFNLTENHTNSQPELFKDLIQALDHTDDSAQRYPFPSILYGKQKASKDVDISEEISVETDDSRPTVENIFLGQKRRNSSGNALRRQLADERGDLRSSSSFTPSRSHVTTTNDNSDVYGASSPASIPRSIPSFALHPYSVRSGPVDSAVLQSQHTGTKETAAYPNIGYVLEDTVPRTPTGHDPYDNFKARDFRRVFVPRQNNFDGNYHLQQYDMRDILAQLTQLLIYHLQQNYNTRLTPAQIALIQMLGINIPPGLLQNSYYPQSSFIPRRQEYPEENIPYNPFDETMYVTNEDPRFYVKRRPFYRTQPQFGSSPEQPFPYDNRRPDRYEPRVQPGLQVFLPRYYPQQPLPYNSPEVQYSQGGRASGRSTVAMPEEVFPEEYRDAVFLRMLLAARARHPSGPRTVHVRPQSPQESASSSTTARPRTLAPVRSVQILDPITEEPTVKRSTDNSTAAAVTQR
ncbi:uncharacterized protein LOC134542561 [Bacillus rossius redtenbacheri]|uniref:uncharacterized protein LOC134542561 n=1 Tax=Bacillus rossius redtenbacheri TaxID=93214 RepID=UPI002FDEB62C